jgi:hypothetical protein
MDTFDHDLAQIAEHLVTDLIDQIPLTTMITVLRECAAQNAYSSPEAIEHATRTQLRTRGQKQRPAHRSVTGPLSPAPRSSPKGRRVR